MDGDLLDPFDGFDALELLSSDPELSSIANDVLNEWGLLDDGSLGAKDIDRFEKVSDDTDDSLAAGPKSFESPKACQKHPSKTQRDSNKVCTACQGPSKGFRYYGASVCNSCRAFFARAVNKDSYKTFLCQNGLSRCSINSKSWVSCQKCRFEQCLTVGMKIPSQTVQCCQETDLDKRKRLRTRLRWEVMRRLAKRFQTFTNVTLFERHSVEKLTALHLETGAKIISRLVRLDYGVFQNVFRFLVHGSTSNSFYMMKTVDDYLIYCGKEIYIQDRLYLLEGIRPRDRVKLVGANMPLISEFMMAAKLGKTMDTELQLFKQMRVLCLELDEEYCERVDSACRQITEGGRLSLQPITYEKAYDQEKLGLQTQDDKTIHKKAALKLSQEALKRGPNEWDPIVCSLIALIIMFTPDFVDLDDPKLISDMQASFASVLHRYLRSQSYPNKELVFRDAMMASSYARQLREFRENAYKRLKMS